MSFFISMNRLISAYRFLNATSIDVTAGAIVCAGFFAKVMNVYVRPSAFIALGLSVWIIYTVDHLLDVKRLTSTASTQRHRFHQRYFKIFSVLVVLALVADVLAVLMIRRPLFIAGLFLSLLILFYLLVQRYLNLFKEFCGGILYTGGVTLPVLMFGYTDIQIPVLLLIIQFLFTTWLNLLLFSYFDKERDEKDHHVSFATKMGDTTTKAVIITLLVICVGLGFYQIVFFGSFSAAIILIMDFILALILLMKNKFVLNERFRLLGDAVFLFPIFYLI